MITSDKLFAFNHDQIDIVCFMGYKTDNQKKLSEILNRGLAELKNKKEAENQE